MRVQVRETHKSHLLNTKRRNALNKLGVGEETRENHLNMWSTTITITIASPPPHNFNRIRIEENR